MRLNRNGMVDVNNIPALRKPFISDKTRTEIQSLYDRLSNYYNLRFLTPKINKSKDIKKFTGGYFYKNINDTQIRIGDVYLKDGLVEYEILADKLPALRLTLEEVELEIIGSIYKPFLIPDLDFYSSVFTSINCHFDFLDQELARNPSGIRFTPYENHKIKVVSHPVKKIITENVQILILDDGIIIITE